MAIRFKKQRKSVELTALCRKILRLVRIGSCQAQGLMLKMAEGEMLNQRVKNGESVQWFLRREAHGDDPTFRHPIALQQIEKFG